MGKPVIVSDHVGSKHIIQDGVNGYVVPYGDHRALAKVMKKLILDRNLIGSMGIQSRKTAEKNTWDHIAIQYRQFFPLILKS